MRAVEFEKVTTPDPDQRTLVGGVASSPNGATPALLNSCTPTGSPFSDQYSGTGHIRVAEDV
jgi:hypothetical protein